MLETLMTCDAATIADLELKAREADRMAGKSPFASDRKRFGDVAAEYRRRADRLKARMPSQTG